MGIRFRKQTRQPFGRGRGDVCFNQSPWVSSNNKADLFSFTFSSPAPTFSLFPLPCSSQNSPRFSSTSISFPSSHFLQIGLLANAVNMLSIFSPLLLFGSHWWELTALRQATLAELLGAGPSYHQMNFLDFLKQAGEQTLPRGLRFSVWSRSALAHSAVCFRGSPQGLAVLGGDQSFSIRDLGQRL